jgi:hypothetical protein
VSLRSGTAKELNQARLKVLQRQADTLAEVSSLLCLCVRVRARTVRQHTSGSSSLISLRQVNCRQPHTFLCQVVEEATNCVSAVAQTGVYKELLIGLIEQAKRLPTPRRCPSGSLRKLTLLCVAVRLQSLKKLLEPTVVIR